MLGRLVLCILCWFTCFLTACDLAPQKQERIAIIYSTDLFHPPGDMDDQVDLAVLYGLPDVDIKLIILDHGKGQSQRPGKIPVTQMEELTGKLVRTEIGLAANLCNQQDKALEQAIQFQAATNALIETLKESSSKIVIITVGSLRDIAAAYNRFPELFHAKVEKLFVFAGEASNKDFTETNVKMDRQAFAAVMNSDLPIYWVPCFDGGLWQNKGNASYWQTTYGKILHGVSDPLLQYFLYAAKRSQEDPLLFLGQEVNEKKKNKLFKYARNLWGSSVFYAATGKTIIQTKSGYDIVSATKSDAEKLLFDFVPVNIQVSSDGRVHYFDNNEQHRVMRFRVRNYPEYKRVMTTVTNDILRSVGSVH